MDMAGAMGRAVAGPGWKAALALVAQEAQTTGTTLERTLKVGNNGSGRKAAHQVPRTSTVPPKRYRMGTQSYMPGISIIPCRLS